MVGTKKKVKSLERFRESVTVGRAGDRLGVCLTQFDPKLLERGLACSPGTLSKMYAAIISLHPIRCVLFAIFTHFTCVLCLYIIIIVTIQFFIFIN